MGSDTQQHEPEENDGPAENEAHDGQEPAATRSGPSRRKLIGWGGAGLALGAAAAGGTAAAVQANDTPAGETDAAVAFHGAHQAGVSTAVQDRMHFAAFDVTTDDREALVDMLKEWTRAAEHMAAGRPVGDGAVGGSLAAPPDDTGEALGLEPARLTLTFGVGPSLFDGRFGLKDRRPEALAELPAFPGDQLEEDRSHGDLCVQACADDPQVVVHAIRNLARIGMGTVAMRWSQLGFGKTASTTPKAQTPRNLMGFKDGTFNISGTDEQALAEHVWVGGKDGAGWLTGGTYLVARRIRMHIETWDRTSLREQQQVFGRTKGEGAPLGKDRERADIDLKALPPTSHVFLAHPKSNDGARILRRGYSFTDGTDKLGRLEAGLFFLAYQRDIREGFLPLQQSLSRHDALNEYIEHVSSAVFAIPPGVRDGHDWWGRELFEGSAA